MLDTLLEDFLQHLRLERGLSSNSVASYRSDIAGLLARCKNRRLESIRPADITGFFATLSRRRQKPATLARKISSIRQFFDYHVRAGRITENPARGYNAPKIVRYHPDHLTPESIERILDSIDDKDRNAARNRAVVELLYGCGLRLSELINLKVSDIEFEAGFVRVLGKGNKQRLVPIGRLALKAAREYLPERDKQVSSEIVPELILNRFGRPFSRVGLWKIIRQLVHRAGISRRVTPHTFRHSFATHMIEGGADLRIVQEMLGHADISTTEVYTQIDRDYIIAEHRKYHPRELARTDSAGDSA
jgi:integrase/recombinase XerD